MTENVPPVPPAPEHPYANWPQPGQGSYPSHGPYGPVPGNEPPYGPPQPYTPPGYVQQSYPPQQAPYPHPSHQAQYPYPPQFYGQSSWGATVKKTGVRTAAGVLTLVMSSWTLLCAFSGFGNGLNGMATLLFLLALAGLTAGILVLTLRRNRGVQIFALVCSGAAAFLALIAPSADYYGPVLPMTLLPLAAAATILSGISLSRGNPGA
ncbi:hypothetical protein ACFVTM_08940 [Arthrobacter sp. NPDC058130]|uniref:hypothetical protein n=1 Tax=Arthrobacter sp. NPDC058130 TaxID=3346353 RepID=UPI0036E72968